MEIVAPTDEAERIDVGFADACQSFVGLNLNYDVILRGAGRAYVEAGV